mgnify:CR=1 FL=1
MGRCQRGWKLTERMERSLGALSEPDASAQHPQTPETGKDNEFRQSQNKRISHVQPAFPHVPRVIHHVPSSWSSTTWESPWVIDFINHSPKSHHSSPIIRCSCNSRTALTSTVASTFSAAPGRGEYSPTMISSWGSRSMIGRTPHSCRNYQSHQSCSTFADAVTVPGWPQLSTYQWLGHHDYYSAAAAVAE